MSFSLKAFSNFEFERRVSIMYGLNAKSTTSAFSAAAILSVETSTQSESFEKREVRDETDVGLETVAMNSVNLGVSPEDLVDLQD